MKPDPKWMDTCAWAVATSSKSFPVRCEKDGKYSNARYCEKCPDYKEREDEVPS